MSMLEKVMKSLAMQGKGVALGLDGLSGAAMKKAPRLSGAIDRVAQFAHMNPKAAGAAPTIGGALLGGGIGMGAGKLDEATTGGGDIPPEVRAALSKAGYDPSEFEDEGGMGFRGGVLGGSVGTLAGLMGGKRGSALAKVAALGGLGGGALGSTVHSYRKRGE